MLELIELQLQYIGRFIDKQTIRFDTLGNFVQVDGENRNTGGSSGAAKSTIFMALDYLFSFPGSRPATVLQSRKIINPEEKDIWVQAKFKRGDDEITLLRSKSNVQITIAGETYKKAKAEEQIDALIGMSRDLFRKIIHKRQDEGGFFLNLGPTEMHNFLMDCIGLSPFKAKMAIVDAELKTLEENIAKANQSIEKDKASLSATQDAILALGLAPVQDMHQEVVDELKKKAERSGLRFVEQRARFEVVVQEYVRNRPDTTNSQYDASVRENLEGRSREIEAKISAVLDEGRQRREGVRRSISEKIQQRSSLALRIQQGDRAKADATKIAEEIKSIRANTCPTCSQEWKTEGAVASEKAKLAELSKLKDLVLDAMDAAAQQVKLDQEIADLELLDVPITDPRLPDLNEELREVTAEILDEKRKAQELYDQQSTEMKARLDAFVAGQGELQKKVDMELEQFRGQADLDRRVYEGALQKLQNYQAAKLAYDASYSKLKEQEEKFQKSIESCKIALQNYNEMQILALETQKAIKYYVAYSFEEALEAISDKATKIIRCIPNTSNATIQLEGTKETQKGAVLEQINAVLSVDGETGVPIKSFSGGERSSIDWAVDLSVIDYIESKTGKGLNIFILDEPFKGLGTIEIEEALEVLKNSNINKKLIIVDHNPEVKQMVQNRLVVIRDGLTSRVA